MVDVNEKSQSETRYRKLRDGMCFRLVAQARGCLRRICTAAFLSGWPIGAKADMYADSGQSKRESSF